MYGSPGNVAFGWGEDKPAAATKRRSSKPPIAQPNKWGRWGNKQGDKAALADKTSGETRKKGVCDIRDKVTRGFHSQAFSLLARILTSFTLSFTLVPIPLCNLCDLSV